MNLQELAKQLAPLIAFEMLKIPVVWGDVNRIKKHPQTYLNNAVLNVSSGDIILEENVFFGHHVSLLTGTHDVTRTGQARVQTFPRTGRDIIIRKGAWLASNVTVVGPCEIGENSVIAAGSVVIENVPPNSLYGGNPAKFIKKLEYDITDPGEQPY